MSESELRLVPKSSSSSSTSPSPIYRSRIKVLPFSEPQERSYHLIAEDPYEILDWVKKLRIPGSLTLNIASGGGVHSSAIFKTRHHHKLLDSTLT